MSADIITINMTEMAVGARTVIIRTMNLGSCVAIVIYDETAKVGGMAHAMLPSRRSAPADVVEEARQRIRGTEAVAKFADESVGRLVAEIEKIGGEKGRFKAKLVGGAKLFRMLSGDDKGVGFRNAEAARNALLRLAIPIEAEDVGGAVGRSATFTIENGLVEITTVI